MNLSDFDYNLPKELIAQKPASPRESSRLLIYNRQNNKIDHKHFYDLPKYLKTGDVLFLNNSKVFSARLFANRKTGAKIEIFLLKNISKKDNAWQCLLKGKTNLNEILSLENNLEAKILEKNENIFNIIFNQEYLDFVKTIEQIGETPLPPYIKKDQNRNDKTNYQTVYAKDNKLGSSAAPTAGLHFSQKIFEELKSKGVEILEATLHVGLGTFLPIKSENILEHKMHSEEVEISAEVINKLIKAKNNQQRIIAVGTTSCRILESLNKFLDFDKNKQKYLEYKGDNLQFSTDIFIYPGYKFALIDGLVTNFHLPKSSLLLLISAIIGREEVLKAYQEAIKEKYRFFSYGDAMFIA